VATVILENVNVDFPIYGAQQRSLRKAIFKRATGGSIERDGKNQDRVTVKALNDISLTLHDGDRLGLIGHNGSGKSTLLKLIAGIYQPVSGHIKVDGRVTPLFDAMPGLDGEDSGYENIITSGMLIGMTREQIEAKIPEIEEFCELGEYLSLPVRTYSTGMTMRLGFALVTALDPGVLLMDEGFGTGDLRFAERAEARMKDFIGRSRIMVLASHSDNTIRSMCNKAVLMDAGKIVAFGPVDDVCEQYYQSVHKATVASEQAAQLDEIESIGYSVSKEIGKGLVEGEASIEEASIENVGLADRLRRSNGAARFTKVTVLDVRDNSRWDFSRDESATVRFEYKILERVSDLAFLFRLNLVPAGGGKEIIFADMREVLSSQPVQAGYEGVIEISLQLSNLMPNRYLPYVWLGRCNNAGGYDVVDANIGLPAFIIRLSAEKELNNGLVSLKYEAKKSGTIKSDPVKAI
jgi:ABC-type polysaccharide/polyol phosphate transport system ATPase subunit